jgi:recombination DNA repair RAD52 pathway protein
MTERESLSPAQLWYLHENLNPGQVAHRRQGSTNLSYMEAWAIKAALIRVFGFGGFSSECIADEMVRADQVPQTKGDKLNWKVTWKATVRLTIHQTGAVYQESAIADASLPDFTESCDAALKSAESDALKRAAIFLGTQFGLSLYNDASMLDVIGAVWSPDQIGKRDQYLRELAEAAQAVQQITAQVPPAVGQMRQGAEQVQDPYMAQVAAGLKVDHRDGPDA